MNRLRSVRYLYAHRSDAPGARDIAYFVYLAALTIGIVGAPLIRAAAQRLASPDTVARLTSKATPLIVVAVMTVAALALLAAGRLRGPVVPEPFRVLLLAGTDLPRERSLLRPFALAALWPIAGALGIAALLGGVLVSVGAMGAGTFALVLVSAVCIGASSSVGWLAGQSLGWAGRLATALTLVAAAAAGYASFALLGWPGVAAVGGIAAVIALLCVPRLLARIDGVQLLADATRWQLAATASIVGDIQHAAGLFRQLPSHGRTWQAIAGPRALLTARSDLVGAARTPLRFAIGTAFAILAWALLVASPAMPIAPWAFGAVGLVMGYLAVGTLSDGYRHAAACATMPALYGHSVLRLYLAHSVAPAFFALLSAVVGALLAALVIPGSVSYLALLGAVVAVVLRAFDSAKGDLPPELLTPQPTPMGDMSGIMVMGWQADALLIALVGGGLIAASGSLLPAVTITAGVVGFLLRPLRRRLAAK